MPPTALPRIKSPLLRRAFELAAEEWAPHFVARSYPVAEKICRFGQPAEGAWIISEGEVSITRQAGEYDLPATESRTTGSVFGYDGGPARGDQIVRAETAVKAVFLPTSQLVATALARPDVGVPLRQFAEIATRRGEIVRALRQAIPFRTVSRRRLLGLVEKMDWRAFRPGEGAITQGAQPSGIYIVLEGELHAWREDGETRTLVDVLNPGEVFGDVATYGSGPEPVSVIAMRPTAAVFLSLADYYGMIATSPAFRRRIGQGAVVNALKAGCAEAETVVLVGPDADVQGRTALTRLVAESVATAYREKPLLLRLGSPATAPRLVHRSGVFEMTVAPNVEDIEAAVLRWHGAHNPIFLLPQPEDTLQGLAHAIGRVIHVSEDVHTPLTGEMASIPTRCCALIARGGDPRGYPSRTTRLRWAPADLARLDPTHITLADLAPDRTAGVARLGRAITERTVGVALGGGGAWGFAHVALIRALLEGDHAVPIDMVAGASFGTLVAAFYCARGLPGLDQLVARGGRGTLYTQLSLVSSRAFQWWVDQELGGARMEELEVPMFPVATDVAYGTEYVGRRGTVGQGARASGAMPPLFTPFLVDGSRIVDGGFINNVPASVLRNEGANFVIASNVIAKGVAIENPTAPHQLGRFLAGFNPLRRVEDMLRSSLVLFHNSGLRESMFADAVYCASFAGMDFWDFGSGERTIQSALADPGFTPAVDRIRDRWRAFSVEG